jgi:Domain of unknown function DUF11
VSACRLTLVVALALAVPLVAEPALGATHLTAPILVDELAHDTSEPLSAAPPAFATDAWPFLPSLPGTGGGTLLGPIQSFEGVSNSDNGPDPQDRFLPADAEGDVGPSDYVQWANRSLSVYTKHGLRLFGPLAGSEVWRGFGGAPSYSSGAQLCESMNRGDPIVLYDQLADRWLLSQFAYRSNSLGPEPPFVQCFAVSATPDPLGPYHRYAFQVPDDLWNDYSKVGLWPTAYVMTDIATRPNGKAVGAGVFALERSQMLQGRLARAVYVRMQDAPPLLPGDLDGGAAPPAGGTPRPLGPPLLVGVDDDALGAPRDALELWRFEPNFDAPEESVLTGPRLLATQPFSNPCGTAVCISVRQQGTRLRLDSLSDRLMFRAEVRRLPGFDALALTHTVKADDAGRAGLRWYELVSTGGEYTIARQGTYAPTTDLDDRWLGSIAIDRAGNLGLGFSMAGLDLAPSIGYTGMAASVGTGDRGEARLVVGGGSQSAVARWGDYSSVTVDPVDGCTFWLTNEYYARDAPADDWQTRIGSFRFPGCGGQPTILGIPGNRPPQEGDLLSARPPGPALPGLVVEFRWRRCAGDAAAGACADIASGPTYRLTAADVDSRIRLVASTLSSTGTTSALSSATPVVRPEPPPPNAAVDLALSPVGVVAPARPGGNTTLVLHVANGSRLAATSVHVVLVPSAGLQISASADRGPGCAEETTLDCDLDFLPAGRTATVTVVGTADERGRFTIKATASAAQHDPNPVSNVASATAVFAAPPLLTPFGSARLEVGAKVVIVSARISSDEAARLAVDVESAAGGNPLPLLAGSSVAGTSLAHRGAVVHGHIGAPGSFGLRLLLRKAPALTGGSYRVVVRATDADRLRSASVLRITPLGRS